MKPSQLSSALLKIAKRIDTSNMPKRSLVIADLSNLVLALENPDDYKSGNIIDGVYTFFNNKDAGSGEYRISSTSYKQINGFITIDGEVGSWVFYVDPEGDGFKITGRVNGDEISEVYFPEEGEDPKEFGTRMIKSLFESDQELKDVFDGKLTEVPSESPSHSFEWEDEPLGGQPNPKY